MAITKKVNRQTTVDAIVDFTFSDLLGTSGVYQVAVDLPAKAIVIGSRIHMDTAFNSGTSDTFSIGDKVGSAAAVTTTFSAAAAIAAGAAQVGTLLGKKMTSAGSIGITWTGVGAAPTAGAGRMVVGYIIDGRASFSQG